MNNISKNIIKYRKQSKMSQEKLAERSDISVGYLSKLERSISDNVSVTILLRIATALDVTLNDLAYENNEKITDIKPNQRELNRLLTDMNDETSEQLCQNIIDSIELLNNK
ncbi:helix-turn-helix transcriptional regulator [Ligilactobacillus saerimneri]|uniref:helix-turn-helix domain-containing protein n=1 Tax=Ligilactobacillus saerimneri TaxID=228229 RepID=UPI0022A6E927|nr:helix-turn-helix transcriptional regulator [Ligilactobacillus saerimneri]MCZ0891708.1 helix-turn-helix transcriptional regulator [Ligilactobacillus saerimneri]